MPTDVSQGAQEMDALQLFKEHYFHEISRRHQLTAGLALPVGVITVLVGGFSFFVGSIDYDSSIISIATITAAVVAGASVLISIYYLIRSHYGYVYKTVARPKKMFDHFKRLQRYYAEKGSLKGTAASRFTSQLMERYAACAQFNAQMNDRKAVFQHKANTFVIVALISFLTGAVPLGSRREEIGDNQRIQFGLGSRGV